MAVAVIAILGTAAVSEREHVIPAQGEVSSDQSRLVVHGLGEVVTSRSETAVENARNLTSQSGRRAALDSRSPVCRALRKAVRYYRSKVRMWSERMGAGTRAVVLGSSGRPATSCPRYLARVLRAKARAARREYERWWAREPKLSGETWRDVRPDTFVNRALYRLAVCETGGINGGEPLLTHSNSTYVGSLGFAWSTWRYYRHRVSPLPPADGAKATWKEQLAVGRALVREFGGFSSWPACHRRLGLG